ncbi:iron-sulfur cluster co-chaperone protein HscB isoform X1 [Scleropages formosus]|uniref:iron-sulfur cluster co-chaperone protein HscB isoform X1 n=1 Tax=Scleropages formosus TaxID=113540 RepID=UPI000878993A|nr:iron-sulfur cluster co-chaperone protein HscB isoform X1 [Scleropages formosus]
MNVTTKLRKLAAVASEMQAFNKLAVWCVSRGIQSEKPFAANTLCCWNVFYRTSSSTLSTSAVSSGSKYAVVELGQNVWPPHFLVGGRFVTRTFCTISAKVRCWQCGHPLRESPAFFCPECAVIQSPDENATYFDIMDCEKSFALDTQKLQHRYLELQRSLHPDNFGQKTQKEQEYSETQSALINKAYRTLLKPLSRGMYMLELVGVHLEEGTDGGDPQFLLEIMDLNERLAETQSKEEAKAIGHSVRGKLLKLAEEINAAFLNGDLHSAKLSLVQMKYFENVEEKVKEKLSASL